MLDTCHRSARLAVQHFSSRGICLFLHQFCKTFPVVLQGKYDTATLLFLRATEIQERILGPNHKDLASPLKARAWILGEQVKFARTLKVVLGMINRDWLVRLNQPFTMLLQGVCFSIFDALKMLPDIRLFSRKTNLFRHILSLGNQLSCQRP